MKKFHHDLDEISVLSMLIDAEKSKPRPQKTADVLISLLPKNKIFNRVSVTVAKKLFEANNLN